MDLQFVRQDAKFVVYAEHPDRIQPGDLSKCLVDAYGQKTFRISLIRNIYVVYVNRDVARQGDVGADGNYQDIPDSEPDREPDESYPRGYHSIQCQQRLKDIEEAKKVLVKARMSHSTT